MIEADANPQDVQGQMRHSRSVVRLSGDALTEGIENHKVEGVPIRVYSAAKTVADRFQVS